MQLPQPRNIMEGEMNKSLQLQSVGCWKEYSGINVGLEMSEILSIRSLNVVLPVDFE